METNTTSEFSLTAEQHRLKMQRRKEVQDQRVAERNQTKGLIIVNTGLFLISLE